MWLMCLRWKLCLNRIAESIYEILSAYLSILPEIAVDGIEMDPEGPLNMSLISCVSKTNVGSYYRSLLLCIYCIL